MADQSITKRALCAALKELMEEESFQKISVADICARCDMNRKSFYYHFRDKYDLVNWIFDTEFIAVVHAKPDAYDTLWTLFDSLCDYFYRNRSFYRKALLIRGQNSFSDHFRELLTPVQRKLLSKLLSSPSIPPMYIDFFNDAIICALERWLTSRDCMPPEKFVSQMRMLVRCTAAGALKDLEEKSL